MVRDLSGPLLCRLFKCSLRYWSCGLEDPDEEDVVLLSVKQPRDCPLVEADVFTASE